MHTLLLYDADNGFAPENVVQALRALPPESFTVGAAGVHTAAARLGRLAQLLSKAGAIRADIRIVVAAKNAADDALVDFALQTRCRTEGAMQIMAFSHDKALLDRLHAVAPLSHGQDIASTQEMSEPQKADPLAQEELSLGDFGRATFLRNFLEEMRLPKGQKRGYVQPKRAEFCRCVCIAAGLEGQGKDVKKRAYAHALNHLVGIGAAIEKEGGKTIHLQLSVLRRMASAQH